MQKKPRHISTGNQYIVLPNINPRNAGIEKLGFMMSAFKSIVELHGPDDTPLIAPVAEVDGKNIFDDCRYRMEKHWIPNFVAGGGGLDASYAIYPVLNRRSFAVVITLTNTSLKSLTVNTGIRGAWKRAYHTVGVKKLMYGVKSGRIGTLDKQLSVFEFRGPWPMFAVAVYSVGTANKVRSGLEEGNAVHAADEQAIHYERTISVNMEPGETLKLPFYIGIGPEEISAASAAKETAMQGSERVANAIRNWLDIHTFVCKDKTAADIINANNLYSYFYTQFVTIDTEKFVIATAGTSDCDHCGIYMDRAANRHAFPAVLQMNNAQARDVIEYVFNHQIKNIGLRSRFIDGVTLENGFELDQLCAPIRAIALYTQFTDDFSLLFDLKVQNGINKIMNILEAQYDKKTGLYETLLRSNGKYSEHPYICFQNVLVWRILLDTSKLYGSIHDLDRADNMNRMAADLKKAIDKNFIKDSEFGKVYAYSVDGDGNFILDDESEGSLSILPYFEFCKDDNVIYLNTLRMVKKIREKWGQIRTFDIVNDLRLAASAGEAIDMLDSLSFMPLGEEYVLSTDDDTRLRRNHNASVAGMLAYTLRMAIESDRYKKKRITKDLLLNSLYQAPPPTTENRRKARL
ncbi:MAG: glycoside hydrolase family 125 protein [Abditibacteriota bacterium]|nr:glycoside hydrolase family 125 protein [Abditibacteriota bacterium]MBP5737705.1 glycoside hydrolase family 125 protein [Abditibacteriota bacterium]